MRIIDVTREESVFSQACNCVCLGDRKVICYDLCDRVLNELRRLDIEVSAVAGSELVKGRGGPRCMTRPIYAPVRPSAPRRAAGSGPGDSEHFPAGQ